MAPLLTLPPLELDAKKLLKYLAIGASIGTGITVAKLLRLWLKTCRIRRMIANVPQGNYEHSPSMGFIPAMMENKLRLHDWRTQLSDGMKVCKVLGPPFDPHGNSLIVRDPVLIRHFLKDNFSNYTKPSKNVDVFWHYFNKWLGDGIFTALHGAAADDEGANWARQRKIASAIFSRGNFNNNMHTVFAEKASRLRELLDAPAAAGERVDMQAKFFGFTMDSIMKIFFGEETRTVLGEKNEYADAYDVAHRCFMEFFVGNVGVLKMSAMLPYPVGGVGGLLWKLTEATSQTYGEYIGAVRTLDRESKRLIKACREDPKLPERKDLLALFVTAEEKDDRFSTRFLRDVVLNFIIAGRDTTACALSWMFYILATNPEVQEKLCREIDEKLPNRALPTLKSLAPSEMPYLQGVIYETFRLYPPVPFDGKVATADDVLPDGTRIAAGTELHFLPYAMGRDPAMYPDPMVIKPERWIPFSAPTPHDFPVFQAGPRICLGMDMAIFEAKLVAAMLLQDYTFTLAPGEAEKIHYSITLTMAVCNSKKQDSHNLWLIPKKRR